MISFFRRIVIHTVLVALTFWALEQYIFSEYFAVVGGKSGYVLVAVLFGVLNALIKPIIKILSAPIHFLTLGFSSLCINGVLLWILERVVKIIEIGDIDIHFSHWLWYVIIGLILAVVNQILHWTRC